MEVTAEDEVQVAVEEDVVVEEGGNPIEMVIERRKVKLIVRWSPIDPDLLPRELWLFLKEDGEIHVDFFENMMLVISMYPARFSRWRYLEDRECDIDIH